jgi:hypothetical protein
MHLLSPRRCILRISARSITSFGRRFIGEISHTGRDPQTKGPRNIMEKGERNKREGGRGNRLKWE